MAMRRKTTKLLGLFLCLTGSVVAGPAMGDEPVGPPASAMQGENSMAAQPTAAPPADTDELSQGQQVEVGSFGQIDLHVKDLELSKVLQLLSMQSERNIVASKNVAGKISADLYDVGFYEALDAVLHPNGFGYEEKNGFIYVYTADQLAQIEQDRRETVSRVMRLNYITASDASTFVSPLLSEAGSISVSGEVAAGMQPSIGDAGANSFAHADTLIIRDYPENVEEIVSVIAELDQRPEQVLVEATVLQARLSEANAFGVDFALFADLDVTDFTTPLGAVDNLVSGQGADGPIDSGGAMTSTSGDVAAGPATVKLGFLGNDAAVFIRALDSVTDTTVLATPKLLVLNRQKAELLVGGKLGYLSTTATETSTTQTVEFLDIGTQLTVRPFVSSDGFVRLELRPSVSDGDTRLEGGFIIPDQTTQELTTNVIVRSGQTVVLGGLFKEDTSVGRRQIPGFGDIPILGNLGKGQDDAVERSEVIFLIKPTVMKSENLLAGGKNALDSIEKLRFGSRQNLLPWSQTKLTSSHVKEAYEHYQAGEMDKALWDVNLALYLDPTLVDALRLKEKITGERFYLHDRSMLDDATNTMIDGAIDALGPEDVLEPIEQPDSGAAAPQGKGQREQNGAELGEVEADQASAQPAAVSLDQGS